MLESNPYTLVLKKPRERKLINALKRKMSEYACRLDDYPVSDSRHTDAFCKRVLLGMVLRQDKVRLEDFSAIVGEEICSATLGPDGSPNPELMVDLIIRAWTVIADYCQTGGQNVPKNRLDL